VIDKQTLLKACKKELDSRILHLQTAIDNARESANSEQKSTAGDKHDTARSMAQFEQEKLSSQLAEQLRTRKFLNEIPAVNSNLVSLGSLVTCTTGKFYVSVGLGKISVGEEWIFCISLASPLGKVLLGKKAGAEFSLNGNNIKILEVT